MDALASFLPLIAIFAIFYLLLIRPQKKRAETHRQLMMSVEEGEEVVMVGGEIGTIKGIRDEEIDLEIAPGVTMRYLRAAIRDKVRPDEEQDFDEDEV